MCHTPSSSAEELSYASVRIFISFWCMDFRVGVGVIGCALSALIAIQSSPGMAELLPAGHPTISPPQFIPAVMGSDVQFVVCKIT